VLEEKQVNTHQSAGREAPAKVLTRVLDEKQVGSHRSAGEEAGRNSPKCWMRSR
jgi:hypothetical protein